MHIHHRPYMYQAETKGALCKANRCTARLPHPSTTLAPRPRIHPSNWPGECTEGRHQRHQRAVLIRAVLIRLLSCQRAVLIRAVSCQRAVLIRVLSCHPAILPGVLIKIHVYGVPCSFTNSYQCIYTPSCDYGRLQQMGIGRLDL